MSEKDLIGKTITKIDISGYGVFMTVDDGTTLYYWASDGGYSSYEICEEEADDEDN